jgi:hypothetical protein
MTTGTTILAVATTRVSEKENTSRFNQLVTANNNKQAKGMLHHPADRGMASNRSLVAR